MSLSRFWLVFLWGIPCGPHRYPGVPLGGVRRGGHPLDGVPGCCVPEEGRSRPASVWPGALVHHRHSHPWVQAQGGGGDQLNAAATGAGAAYWTDAAPRYPPREWRQGDEAGSAGQDGTDRLCGRSAGERNYNSYIYSNLPFFLHLNQIRFEQKTGLQHMKEMLNSLFV